MGQRFYSATKWTSRVRGIGPGTSFAKTDCDAYLVFNGTAAKWIALLNCATKFHRLSSRSRHIQQMSAARRSSFSPALQRLLLVAGAPARSTSAPTSGDAMIGVSPGCTRQLPRVISAHTRGPSSAPVYTHDESRAIAELGRKNARNVLHMDGARFANPLPRLVARLKK